MTELDRQNRKAWTERVQLSSLSNRWQLLQHFWFLSHEASFLTSGDFPKDYVEWRNHDHEILPLPLFHCGWSTICCAVCFYSFQLLYILNLCKYVYISFLLKTYSRLNPLLFSVRNVFAGSWFLLKYDELAGTSQKAVLYIVNHTDSKAQSAALCGSL